MCVIESTSELSSHVQYQNDNAKHVPVFTTGGSSAAEIATPTCQQRRLGEVHTSCGLAIGSGCAAGTRTTYKRIDAATSDSQGNAHTGGNGSEKPGNDTPDGAT